MNCADYMEWISGHIDAQNSAEEEAQLQAHLAECADCREILAAYEQINAAVSMGAEPPSGLASAVMESVYRQTGAAPVKKKKKFFRAHGAAFAAAAAVLVILFGAGLLDLPGHSNMIKTTAAGGDTSTSESVPMQSNSAKQLDVSAVAAAQHEETAQSASEETVADAGEDAYDSAANYNAVFDMLSDAAEGGTTNALPQETAGDSAMLPETPACNEPTAAPGSPETEAECAEGTASGYSVFVEVYDYAEAVPIKELADLMQSETHTNIYYGTAAEILSIVKQYENTHNISCVVASGYADTDTACITIFE